MRQNRVGPDGDPVADPARGGLMGNRGVLHDDRGTVRRRHGPVRAWVICLLDFKGRKRALMQPGRYTELFFLDEAVALAAGHRPCGECRRHDYTAFRRAWDAAHGPAASLADVDRQMHADRIDPATRQQRVYAATLDDLADGTFVRRDGVAHLVLGDRLLPFAFMGYGHAIARPTNVTVEVLTPATTVGLLRAGYRPTLHPTARFLS